MENLINNQELLELVEEEIEKVVGGKIDVKMGASRVLATALSALSVAGGVSTHAMKPTRGFSTSASSQQTGENIPQVPQGQQGPQGPQVPQVPQRQIQRRNIPQGRIQNFMNQHFRNLTTFHNDAFWNANIYNCHGIIQNAQYIDDPRNAPSSEAFRNFRIA